MRQQVLKSDHKNRLIGDLQFMLAFRIEFGLRKICRRQILSSTNSILPILAICTTDRP